MAQALQRVGKQLRFIFPYLWHIQHPHAKEWAATPNGLALDRDMALHPDHDLNAIRPYERMTPGYWDHSVEWGEFCRGKLAEGRRARGQTQDIPDSMQYITQSPEFQRWSVDPTSMYDQTSLPL